MKSSPEPLAAWSPDHFADDVQSDGAEGPLLLPDFMDLPVPVRSVPEPALSPVDEAYHRGYAEGVRQGELRACAGLDKPIAALRAAAEGLAAAQDDYNRTRSRNLAGLAIAIAQQVIQRELTADPELLKELVRKALELLPTDLTVEIHLAPGDLDRLRGSLSGVVAEGRPVEIRWVADPTQEPGGFVIETPQRLVDGRTDVALRAIYERLAYD